MARYIDADKLLDFISEHNQKDNMANHKFTETQIFDFILNTPTADAKEVIHGKWAKDAEYPLTDVRCSTCSIRVSKCLSTYFNFCPNCGAVMKEESK